MTVSWSIHHLAWKFFDFVRIALKSRGIELTAGPVLAAAQKLRKRSKAKSKTSECKRRISLKAFHSLK